MDKLFIKNAHIVTSKCEFDGAVLCADGIIAQVFKEGEPLPETSGAKVVDAKGKYLLPGGIDAHTHFDLDFGFTRASDDFYTGSVAAACGGTTTVIDHISSAPEGKPITYIPQQYHELARPAVIDYGFHGTTAKADDEVLADMEKLCADGITSIKLYMTYDDIVQDDAILKILHKAKELGMVVCAHCENDASINELRARFVAEGKKEAKYHPLSRPSQAEAEAVWRFLMLAKMADEPHAFVVHLSSALGLAAANMAKAAGQRNVYLETCPQYLFLDDSKYEDPKEGLKYIMSPPLRSKLDVELLWNGVRAGEYDTIATDHCPFFFEPQKQRGASDFTQCPNGAPGVELRVPLLFSKAYADEIISLPQMVSMCCTRPAEIFGIAPKKGDILPGADADLVLFDQNIQWTVTKADLHENVDYTPYEGIRLTGRPVMTVSRGEVIVENNNFVGQKGRGQYLHRAPLGK